MWQDCHHSLVPWFRISLRTPHEGIEMAKRKYEKPTFVPQGRLTDVTAQKVVIS
jgi:hypothetical protein